MPFPPTTDQPSTYCGGDDTRVQKGGNQNTRSLYYLLAAAAAVVLLIMNEFLDVVIYLAGSGHFTPIRPCAKMRMTFFLGQLVNR